MARNAEEFLGEALIMFFLKQRVVADQANAIATARIAAGIKSGINSTVGLGAKRLRVLASIILLLAEHAWRKPQLPNFTALKQ
jgi:hypothetical protein